LLAGGVETGKIELEHHKSVALRCGILSDIQTLEQGSEFLRVISVVVTGQGGEKQALTELVGTESGKGLVFQQFDIAGLVHIDPRWASKLLIPICSCPRQTFFYVHIYSFAWRLLLYNIKNPKKFSNMKRLSKSIFIVSLLFILIHSLWLIF
jgi:hypothetical protein